MKTISKIGTGVALATVIAAVAGSIVNYQLYQQAKQENTELKNQVSKLTQQEERAIIMQHINAQMEEIANDQRHISDEQREEAIEQKHVAENMRRNAEAEKQKAQTAQQLAEEASQLAQRQRTIAEQQRSEAEHSKRITDTLNYVTLARQLGSVSITQRLAGNTQLADMLAYMAYQYTIRYHGDIYHTSIYQALTEASQGLRVWNRHKGLAYAVEFMPGKSEQFATCSTYGEVILHQKKDDNTLQSETLFSNNSYDFRDVYLLANGDIYAVSRNGRVIIMDTKGNVLSTITPPQQDHLLGATPLGDDIVIIGERTLTFVNQATRQAYSTIPLNYQVTCFSRYDNCPILFDNQGKMHIVRSATKTETKAVPCKGQVTAFASSKGTRLVAYGMKDGSIWLKNGKSTTQLVGHRSRISKIKINGWRLYSSSFDGTVNLWMADKERMEPITLFSIHGWITDFTFDNQKNTIWTCDYRGIITRAYISVPIMVGRLKNKLNHNFTHDEWNYFIGSNVPYESIMGKEDRP